jgi:hypothetical protein
MDRYPPGRAARWSGNQRNRERHSFEHLPEEQPHRNRDPWIERYVPYLTREFVRLGGGPIGLHYLACITASYREFQATGTQRARFRTWLGIRTLCQWSSQLKGGQIERFRYHYPVR